VALGVTPVVAVDRPPASPSFDGIDGLSSRVTSLADFYVVDEAIVDPDVDPQAWRLLVTGRVERPLELTYADVLAMPMIEQFATLECISNPVGGDLISTALWTGVPMPYLLGRVGALDDAVEVVFRAFGGYADSIPIADAERADVLIAVGMNRKVLPREHGFPARLLAPGFFGMKQPKWLEAIEVVAQPFSGYWEERGWVKAAVVKTMSRVDAVTRGQGGLEVAGVAFAGIRGVARVEVSSDGGSTWREAELETALSTQTWRRWRLPLRADGVDRVMVRAVDGEGNVQVAEPMDPHPSGATGYDRVDL
jgi:DMSO/TMAO reductase YedYZ molybdopterin-dependent catalytic subunit